MHMTNYLSPMASDTNIRTVSVRTTSTQIIVYIALKTLLLNLNHAICAYRGNLITAEDKENGPVVSLEAKRGI